MNPALRHSPATLTLITAVMWCTGWIVAPQTSAQNAAQQQQPVDPQAPATTDPANPADPDPVETPDDPPKETEELPLLSDMKLPADEQLLRGPREDWVVLRNDRVIVSEPVTPRPKTLEAMRQKITDKLAERRGLSGADLDKFRDEFNRLHQLELHLPDQEDEADYLLHIDDISQIILHEDQMLLRVDQLIRQDQLELAYEFLIALERAYPQWPGADVRHHALLMAEVDRRIKKDDYESALLFVEELFGRNPGLFGLSEKAGEICDHLINQAAAKEDWRAIRYFVSRLAAMFSGHAIATRWENDLSGRAQQHLASAERARAAGDHRKAAVDAQMAASLWPQTRNLRARVRPFLDRFQQLHVGVVQPRDDQLNDPLLHSAGANRRSLLSDAPFFEMDRVFDGGVHYRTRFCERWEPLNLGREILFDLKTGRQAWESQPIVQAADIAASLADRLDPQHPDYDERLASYTNSVVVHSPQSFSLLFDHVPARPEALLKFPVQSAADAPSGQSSADELSLASAEVVRERAERFTQLADNAGSSVFRRSRTEPDGLGQYHVAEVREHTYPDSDTLLQALQRGDVSMALHLPPWDIDRLRKDEQMQRDFFLQPMALPVTHVLQFNPRSRPLRIREYRRALAYALNRPLLIEEQLLRGASSDLVRTVEGPFPSASYATSALVRSRDYDPMAAVALAMAARQQLGGELAPLTMIVPTDAVIRALAQEMVTSWARFGITVEIADPPEGPLLVDDGEGEPAWDIAYRTVQMGEPVTDLWPFLALTNRARVADLNDFPDWLRQEIIELDRLSDWSAAVRAAKQLHVHLWAEMHLIPLWEVDEYLVYRKNIRGVPEQPVQPYQRTDGWIVETWYAEDKP